MGGYREIKCIDKAGFNIEAFRMVIPDDWTCYGGVTWVNDIHMPVHSSFAVVSPDGKRAAEGFPVHKYMWNQNPFQRMSMKSWETQSSKVHAPVEADVAILDTVVGTYRSKMQNLKIVSHSPLPPNDPMMADPAHPPQSPVKYGRARITYTIGTVAIEEEIYGMLEVVQVPMNGMILCTLSSFGIRAGQGELDANMNLFRMIKTSMKVNPAWIQQVVQTMNGLYQQQISNIQQIGAFSRRWSQMTDQVRDMRMKSWEESNRAYDSYRESVARNADVMDRVAERQSETIRGVDLYYDPHEERTVELEGGHVAAWTNALGDRILSDSYNYNPNENLTGNWTRMDLVP